jgi:hypothetical protein
MMRFIYRLLLQLHPVRFRRRFAEEMLLIFDEAPKKTWLVVDGVGSMARQWLLRSGLWKWLLAGLGGLLTLIPGMAVIPSRAPSQLDSVRLDSPVGFVMLIALGSVLAVSFTLILATTWFRFSGRRRA